MPPNSGVGFIAAAMAFTAVLLHFSLHKIDEGHVGVYYRVSVLSLIPQYVFIALCREEPSWPAQVDLGITLCFLSSPRLELFRSVIFWLNDSNIDWMIDRRPCRLMRSKTCHVEPGIYKLWTHFKTPDNFISSTSGGVMIYFDRIEVVNMLRPSQGSQIYLRSFLFYSSK